MATIKLGNLYHESTTEPNSVTNPVNVKDINSASMKSRLDLLATESKLEQVRVLLAGVATEAKLEQARVLLNTISTKDFATQTTLAAVLAKLGQLETEIQAVKANQLSGEQKVQQVGQIALGDEQVTVEEDDVKSLSPPQGATVAYITVSDGAVRYRIGADPTGTLGHRANGDDDIVLASAEDIAAFRVTNDVDQSYSTIFVTYSGAVS